MLSWNVLLLSCCSQMLSLFTPFSNALLCSQCSRKCLPILTASLDLVLILELFKVYWQCSFDVRVCGEWWPRGGKPSHILNEDPSPFQIIRKAPQFSWLFLHSCLANFGSMSITAHSHLPKTDNDPSVLLDSLVLLYVLLCRPLLL